MRFVLVSFILSGCIIVPPQQRQGPQPPPSNVAQGGGGATCAQIVQTCDVQCRDPFCLQSCTQTGSPDGAQQHAALLSCGQAHGCVDEACMRASCPNEVGTCEASAQQAPGNDPPQQPDQPQQPQQPPSSGGNPCGY